MNEPAGWAWIEAWRSGTISDEDFAQLKQLLRDSPEARRTLRRAMLLDSLLRERADAGRLVPFVSESHSRELESCGTSASLVEEAISDQPVVKRRFRITARELLAWGAVAACVAVIVAMSVNRAIEGEKNERSNAVDVTLPSPIQEESGSAALTLEQLREHLLASDPQIMHLELKSDGVVEVAEIGSSWGDIVWSTDRQLGFLRLPCPTRSDQDALQYQIWILGNDVSGDEMIHGGSFPVDACSGEIIVPIQVDQFVQRPRLFVVSVDSDRGGTSLATAFWANAYDGFEP